MSDIDDELLALAGGDVSSDEEIVVRDRSREAPRSQTPPVSSKKESAAAKSAQTKRAPPRKGKKARSDDEEEVEQDEKPVEEGEASSVPGSPSSQQSVPMDESDSDAESAQGKPAGGDEDENKYPYEGLFANYEEKLRIMAMVEIEREQILAERREWNERIRQRQVLRQLMENRKEDSKKRKLSVSELEEGQRKTSRVRTKVGGTKVGETSSGIDNLRRAREERHNRIQQRERENDRRKPSPSRRREADGESGNESDDESIGPRGRSKPESFSPEVREAAPVELRDIERIRVGRSRFAEVCFFPGFEDAITGCFVRINIGPDPSTQEDVYRMAVIKGFIKGKPYAVQDHRGQQLVVDSYVKAAHGKAQREWPFIMCSDRGFTESEWNRYKQVCLTEGVNIAKKPSLVQKIDDINRLVKRSWTELELVEKLERQNTLRSKYSGANRERLEKQIADARFREDYDRVAKLQGELEHLETPRLAFKTSLTTKKKPDRGPSRQDIMAQLNAENRRKTAEEVRKAQVKEIKHAREIEMKLRNGELLVDDPSRRLKPRMKFMHDANDDDDFKSKKEKKSAGSKVASATSTPAGSTPNLNPQLMPHILKAQEQMRLETKAGIPTIHRPVMDDDVIAALDLDIDIEI